VNFTLHSKHTRLILRIWREKEDEDHNGGTTKAIRARPYQSISSEAHPQKITKAEATWFQKYAANQ
jgi:hypothetical protein